MTTGNFGALRAAALLSAALLSACAAKQEWNKPGATTNDFTQSRYACMQQSQQSFGTAYIGRYGGSAQSGMATNGGLFDACMNSQGWTLERARTPEEIAAQKNLNDDFIAEGNALCAREEFQAHYRKSPCRAGEPTFEQLADKSRITPAEKLAFSKSREAISDLDKRIVEAIKQSNPPNLAAIIRKRDEIRAEYDRLALEFYDGRMTRGEYNTKRRDIDLRNRGAQ